MSESIHCVIGTTTSEQFRWKRADGSVSFYTVVGDKATCTHFVAGEYGGVESPMFSAKNARYHVLVEANYLAYKNLQISAVQCDENHKNIAIAFGR